MKKFKIFAMFLTAVLGFKMSAFAMEKNSNEHINSDDVSNYVLNENYNEKDTPIYDLYESLYTNNYSNYNNILLNNFNHYDKDDNEYEEFFKLTKKCYSDNKISLMCELLGMLSNIEDLLNKHKEIFNDDNNFLINLTWFKNELKVFVNKIKKNSITEEELKFNFNIFTHKIKTFIEAFKKFINNSSTQHNILKTYEKNGNKINTHFFNLYFVDNFIKKFSAKCKENFKKIMYNTLIEIYDINTIAQKKLNELNPKAKEKIKKFQNILNILKQKIRKHFYEIDSIKDDKVLYETIKNTAAYVREFFEDTNNIITKNEFNYIYDAIYKSDNLLIFKKQKNINDEYYLYDSNNIAYYLENSVKDFNINNKKIYTIFENVVNKIYKFLEQNNTLNFKEEYSSKCCSNILKHLYNFKNIPTTFEKEKSIKLIDDVYKESVNLYEYILDRIFERRKTDNNAEKHSTYYDTARQNIYITTQNHLKKFKEHIKQLKETNNWKKFFKINKDVQQDINNLKVNVDKILKPISEKPFTIKPFFIPYNCKFENLRTYSTPASDEYKAEMVENLSLLQQNLENIKYDYFKNVEKDVYEKRVEDVLNEILAALKNDIENIMLKNITYNDLYNKLINFNEKINYFILETSNIMKDEKNKTSLNSMKDFNKKIKNYYDNLKELNNKIFKEYFETKNEI